MKLFLNGVAAIALTLAAVNSATAQTTDPVLVERVDTALATRMDAVIDRAVDENRIVGTVILVARNGEIVYRRAAGLADREAGTPMTEETIFRLASVTKPIVSAAAMRLVEEGRIGLDDPVTDWLPDFRPLLEDGSAAIIRIRHLLSHTAGLSYAFFEAEDGPYRRAGVSDGLAGPDITLDENLGRIASVPLGFEPGSQWRYSLAIDVLGAVLQAETGESLPALVDRLITEPLGMEDTVFTLAERDLVSAAYADGSPEPVQMDGETVVPLGDGTVTFDPERAFDPDAYPSGGAGMSGTADDLLRFFEAIRRGGAPILGTSTVETMMADEIGTDAQTQGPGWGFGFGWAVLGDPQLAQTPQSKGTLQWGGAYGHNWFIDPAEDLTVVALTNTAFEGMSGDFTREIRDAAYE